MADVITRFRLETSDYSSKLRDAAKGLKEFSHTASMAGTEFGKFTQKNVEVARSFGNIATSATNTKDKVKELVGAYNDVAKAYNALTKEQQQSDFGKAMAQSLQTLQGRIQEAKAEMNSTGGILGQLKEKFVFNIDAMKLFSMGLTAAKAALDVAKDAFFASEQNVDEWAGVVAASESVYEGFLTAINNGDISGYLGRIDQIVKAAREAYNELDRLGTMKTIQAPAMSKQEAENNRMRMMIMTGRYIAPADGRKAAMDNGTLLSPEQIRSIESKLQNGMKTIVSLTKNELDQTGKAIDAYYNKLAVQNGMSLSEFRKGTSSMAEFDKRVAGARKYDEWQMAHSYVDQSTGRLIAPRTGNPYAQYAGWNNFRVDKQGPNSYNDLVNLIKQQQQQQSQLYSTMGQAYRTVNRAEGVTVRNIMGGSGGGGKGGGKGFDTSKVAFNGGDVLKPEDFIATPSVWEQYADGIKSTFDTIGDEMSNLKEWTNNFDPYTQKIEEMTKRQQQLKMAQDMAAQSAQNFGAALANIDDPAAKAAGTVIQAIANIALGFSNAAAQAGSMGPWGWLAYVAAGTAALATTISTVHSLTGYAQGGMVEGNKYSGDQIPAMLNAGEVVLTKAMQGNLASQLQGEGQRKIQVYGKLAGNDIILSADRTLRLQGKELMVWGRV